MGTALGSILPLAIGVALSPLPIIAVILMLFSKKARSTSVGFLIGWFLGVLISATIIVFTANPAEQATGGDESPLYIVVHLLLGVFLLFIAYRDWKKRPKPGEQVEMPKWMQGLDNLTAGKALMMGALLSGLNPKNLAFTISAGVIIASAGLDTTQAIAVILVYTLLACITVAAPVVIYFVMGDKATPTLTSWKEWLTYHNAAVMTVLFIVFGFMVLGKGIGALIGG